MRIVGGAWRGRQIVAPESELVRPTPDRVREAWMNILQLDIPDARVLDLYAGTGALGLEALSRGAARVDFVDSDPRSLRLVEENIAGLGAAARSIVHRDDAMEFVSRLAPTGGRPPYDLTCADPPYHQGIATQLVTVWLARRFSTILCVEHEARAALPAGGDSRRYGTTSVTFYRS